MVQDVEERIETNLTKIILSDPQRRETPPIMEGGYHNNNPQRR